MQVVKKQNIINSLTICFVMLCGGLSAQYTPTLLTDSIKQEILIKNHHILQQSTITDLSVDRTNMAIFCKWELDLEDLTTIPVKFRLGSQEIVDRLEQKGPTTIKID